jgi:hypothetical protein
MAGLTLKQGQTCQILKNNFVEWYKIFQMVKKFLDGVMQTRESYSGGYQNDEVFL